MSITPAQCFHARAMLGLERSALAAMARMSLRAVEDFESGQFTFSFKKRRVLQLALEAAGVEFFAENGGGAGVRLRKPTPSAIPVEELNASNDEEKIDGGAI